MSQYKSLTARSGAAFLALYAVTLIIGMLSYFDETHPSTFWPGSGLLLIALTFYIYRDWLKLVGLALIAQYVVFLGFYGVESFLTISIFALSNLIEGAIGAFLIRLFLPRIYEQSAIRTGLVVASCGVFGGATVSAMIGAMAVQMLNPNADFWSVWQVWVTANAIGIMIVAPAAIPWLKRGAFGLVDHIKNNAFEGSILLIALGALMVYVSVASVRNLTPYLSYSIVVLPLLLWLAIRLELRIYSLILFVFAIVTIQSTRAGFGPFATDVTNIGESINLMQSFLILAAISTYLISGVVIERNMFTDWLRAAHESLQHHIAHCPLAVMEWNSEYRLTRWSDRAEELFGWSADEVIGKHWTEIGIFADEDRASVSQFADQLKDGIIQSRVGNRRNKTKDGGAIHGEWYTTAKFDSSGDMESLLSRVLDVTDRVESERKIKELQLQLELENEYLREEVNTENQYSEIIGDSAALKHTLSQISIVAPQEITVLINGESGTGKELVARAIHRQSGRKDHTLVKVNCASIPKDLFESEFFGHIKGSFTGAVRDRMGRFQLADKGTLFLDEVGEIPYDLQGKLLRVIQEGEFERVGEDKTRSVDVRIIAATNRDLQKEAKAGRFRQDLYYRLNVFPITLPPLRERLEDIPALAEHFVERICRRLNKAKPTLKKKHILFLQDYSWPGNVREFENIIERAVITSQGDELQLALPEASRSSSLSFSAMPAFSEQKTLTIPEIKVLERKNLIRALESCNWKVFGKGGAAELLEAHPNTVSSRMKALGITKPQSAGSSESTV